MFPAWQVTVPDANVQPLLADTNDNADGSGGARFRRVIRFFFGGFAGGETRCFWLWWSEYL